MKLEDLVLKNSQADFADLKKYGFIKKKNNYVYQKVLPNSQFLAQIKVNAKGQVTGKVIDREAKSEYVAIHTIQTGKFVNEIRQEYTNLLQDIKSKCFISHQFHTAQANRIVKRIEDELGQKPEFLFVRFPDFATFCIPECAPKLEKSYATIAYLGKDQYFSPSFKGASGPKTEILSFKFNPANQDKIMAAKEIYPSYFIRKRDWAALFLDDSIPDDTVMSLLKASQQLSLPDKYWLIPANPKYFDVIAAFKKNKIITWKQSKNIKTGDIVFMYVGAPVSAILYKCLVLKTNIPYSFKGKNKKVRYAMKIKRLKVYTRTKFTFKKLKQYDVRAVRGPRHLPLILLKKL